MYLHGRLPERHGDRAYISCAWLQPGLAMDRPTAPRTAPSGAACPPRPGLSSRTRELLPVLALPLLLLLAILLFAASAVSGQVPENTGGDVSAPAGDGAHVAVERRTRGVPGVRR